jgi:hypothetical protein
MKITLEFRENEMPHIESIVSKFFGRKPKNKKELKRLVEMFISTLTNRGIEAVEDNRQYIELE